MMEQFAASQWETICIRLLLALILGGILGFERERKLMPAGLRTHILVCLGATLVMMTNEYIGTIYQINDISRMGAQVISGIGFLGAGTIIVTRNNRVHGLTTAAGLWASACVGLAIGIGYYSAAILFGIFIFITLTLLQWVDRKVIRTPHFMNVYLELTDIGKIKIFLEALSSLDIKTDGMEVHTEKGNSNPSPIVGVTIGLTLPSRQEHTLVIASLLEIDGVTFAKEI